jgi:hypothetical protein
MEVAGYRMKRLKLPSNGGFQKEDEEALGTLHMQGVHGDQ